MLKISIITVCYNSVSTIENTLRSVAEQDYSAVEHILIDGASKDGTLDMIRRFSSVSILLSEPDKGIYDAMNKGLRIASGDILCTLNSDDFYIDNNVLSEVAKMFADESVDACFADLVYVSQDNTDKIIRYWKSQDYQEGLFKKGWMPAHPTFFARKSVYENFGNFDLSYKLAADFELLFRFIEINKIKTLYLPKLIIKMRLGGATNKNLKNIHHQNNEIFKVLRSHYQDFSVLKFGLNKIKNRFFQFTRRPPID